MKTKKITFNKLVSIAYKITNNYPQKWGDCYVVNSTVAIWINIVLGKKVLWVWQVKAHIDREIKDIYDEGERYTSEPDHIICTKGERIAVDKKGYWKEVGIEDKGVFDFSNVFVDDKEAEIEYITFEDELGGQIDGKLMKLLNNELNE